MVQICGFQNISTCIGGKRSISNLWDYEIMNTYINFCRFSNSRFGWHFKCQIHAEKGMKKVCHKESLNLEENGPIRAMHLSNKGENNDRCIYIY